MLSSLRALAATFPCLSIAQGQPCRASDWTYLSDPAHSVCAGGTLCVGPESRQNTCQNGVLSNAVLWFA
eukprot:705051-Pelagomonas_calceolata.AAC.2